MSGDRGGDGGGVGACCGYVFPAQGDNNNLGAGLNVADDDAAESGGDDSSVAEFKVILLGNSGVGKTAIVQRYDKDTFAKTHQATIGASFMSKEVEVVDGGTGFAFPSAAASSAASSRGGKEKGKSGASRSRLQIWDTAGEEKYRAMTSFYFRKCAGAVMVFDVTSEKSWADIETFWLDHFRQECPDAEVILVGNKTDMCESAPASAAVRRAQRFADERDLTLVLSSAKTGAGVAAIFTNVAQLCYDARSLSAAFR